MSSRKHLRHLCKWGNIQWLTRNSCRGFVVILDLEFGLWICICTRWNSYINNQVSLVSCTAHFLIWISFWHTFSELGLIPLRNWQTDVLLNQVYWNALNSFHCSLLCSFRKQSLFGDVCFETLVLSQVSQVFGSCHCLWNSFYARIRVREIVFRHIFESAMLPSFLARDINIAWSTNVRLPFLELEVLV